MSTEPRTAPPPRTERRRPSSVADLARRWASDRRLPDVLAGVAMLLSGAVLLHFLSRITFWHDEWNVLLHRRGWSVGTFLDPVVEHLVAIPILIYKLLLEAAGMNSPAPYQLVAVLTFIASIALLFVYVRARLGPWVALAAILPILFMGPAWDDLLFPYQMTWFGSVACGIGALLCLERDTRRWDISATVLLVGGLLFSDAGIPFVAGAAVEVGLSPRRLDRAFVPVFPAALWGLWYLGWGHTAHTFISLDNVANLPSYVLDGLSSTVAVYLGLTEPFGVSNASALDWGRPFLLLVVALAVWRLLQLRRPPNRFLTVLAVLIAYWSLTALNASPLGPPTAGRYQYLGVVGLALVAAELWRNARIGPWLKTGLIVAAVMASLSNYTKLRDAANGLAGIAQQTRGGLAALELARDRVDPGLELTQQNSDVDYLGLMDAGSYLSAVDAFGSPAYSPAALASSPEPARVAADKVSGAALRIRLQETSLGGELRCVTADAATGPTARVPPGGLIIRPQRGGVIAGLRRYAHASFQLSFGTLSAGRSELLRIPPDRSALPWTLQLSGVGEAAVCPAEAPSP